MSLCSTNSFASNLDAAAAAGETTPDREKVIRALATVEQTTSVPSSQIFLKLMSDIDRWDSWDVAAVRSEFYFQMTHLIANENGANTIDCLHMVSFPILLHIHMTPPVYSKLPS